MAGLSLFTSRQPWPALDEYVGRGTALERDLPDLTARQAIMLMDNLPRLRRAPLASKIAIFNKVGGHPKSLELLEGWLSSGRLTDLLDDAALDGLLRPQWEDYFLKTLLAQLPEAERETLVRLSIFETALDDEEFTYAGVTSAALQRWQRLSLLQRQQGAAPEVPAYLLANLALLPEEERRPFQPPVTYALHPLVRDYLLGGLGLDERTRLHAWAAEFYGKPFLENARDTARQHKLNWTNNQIEQFARHDQGVVGQQVARTDDLPAARGFMARALDWQAQLFRAGQFEAAGEIVTAVWQVLARWGERDRAKALLQGSIQKREGFGKAVAQGNLASLLKDEGHLAEALATYEQVYATFATLDAKPQLSAVLGQQSIVLMHLGRVSEALAKQEASLEIRQTSGDEQGQAISLHQLSMLHEMQNDYPHALKRSQAAEVLARKVGNEALVAATLHEQGNIFNCMADAPGNESAARADQQTAAERFRQSLEIQRRIGNQSGAADALGALGKLLRDSGKMPEAIAALNEALDIYTRQGNPAKVGQALKHLGLVHERQGQFRAALEKFQQALRLAQQYGSPQTVAIEEKHIARVQAKL